MRAVTIKDAKAHLNELIDAATKGEQIVLMRGSKHVATLMPISDDDLELAPHLTDDQASRLWQSLAREKKAGKLETFASPEQAARHLEREPRRAVARHRGR
jgi:prevent-host-death family protein